MSILQFQNSPLRLHYLDKLMTKYPIGHLGHANSIKVNERCIYFKYSPVKRVVFRNTLAK